MSGHFFVKRKIQMKNDSPESLSPVVQKSWPLLDMSALRVLDFPHHNDCTYNSWSPKEAFDARDDEDFLSASGNETLQLYLANPDLRTSAHMLLGTRSLPRKDSLISIYRSIDRECGSEYGAILLGAAASTSMKFAQWFELPPSPTTRTLFTSKVLPDELLSHGNPESFIYIPRSLQVGFDRYLADAKRTRTSTLI
jgi:hypothetical protein